MPELKPGFYWLLLLGRKHKTESIGRYLAIDGGSWIKIGDTRLYTTEELMCMYEIGPRIERGNGESCQS